ncbi:MAG: hypothetical protein WCT36_03940 [Candidatus Gracilibacteria bacterium]
MANETPDQKKEAVQAFETYAKEVADKGKAEIDKFGVSETGVGKGREAKNVAKGHLEIRIQALKERSAERVTRQSLASLKEDLNKQANEYLEAIKAIMVKAAKRELETDAEKKGGFVLNDKERQDFFALLDGMDKLRNSGITPDEKALFLRVSREDSPSGADVRKIGDLMARVLDQDATSLSNYEQFRQTAIGTLFGVLKPADKMTAAKHLIDVSTGKNDKIVKWLSAMGNSGALGVAQIEELKKYAVGKGIREATGLDTSKMADVAQKFQKKMAEIHEHVKNNGDDTNPALTMLTLGNTLGLAGVAWGALTIILNVAVTLKDGDYAAAINPYTAGAVAAIGAGWNQMTGKIPLEDTIMDPSAKEKTDVAVAQGEATMKETLNHNPKVAKFLANRNGFHVAMRALNVKLAARSAQAQKAPAEQPEIAIEYADLLNASQDTRGPEASQRNRDVEGLNNPASMKAVNEVIKYASLMGWKYDAGKPTITQNRFSDFYKKYTKEYGVV